MFVCVCYLVNNEEAVSVFSVGAFVLSRKFDVLGAFHSYLMFLFFFLTKSHVSSRSLHFLFFFKVVLLTTRSDDVLIISHYHNGDTAIWEFKVLFLLFYSTRFFHI